MFDFQIAFNAGSAVRHRVQHTLNLDISLMPTTYAEFLCRLNSYINCLGNSNITIHSYIFLGIYAYKESYLIKGMHV